MKDIEYAGFWVRVGASLLDTLLLAIVSLPLLTAIYGMGYWESESLIVGYWDVLINFVFPAVAVFLFWLYKSATPGKMALNLSIVDARTGEKPSSGQLIGRYLGYYISLIPLLLGFIWVGVDRRKRGWHDMLAGTVVIKHNVKEPVLFEVHA